jgi:hypothetical protein
MFVREASGEKSLLVLVQEHSTRDVPKNPGRGHDTGESLAADPLVDVEEEDRQGIDHLLMRLGSNGF